MEAGRSPKRSNVSPGKMDFHGVFKGDLSYS